jgi:hypothetical protein
MAELFVIRRIEPMLNIKPFKPIQFYPYPHVVADKILSYECKTKWDTEFFVELRKNLIDSFMDSKITAYVDNKIVFSILFREQLVFVGFYGWTIDVGYSIGRI